MCDLLISRGVRDISFLKPVQEADFIIEKLEEMYLVCGCDKSRFVYYIERITPLIKYIVGHNLLEYFNLLNSLGRYS